MNIEAALLHAYWGGALRDDRMRKVGERIPWDPEDIFF